EQVQLHQSTPSGTWLPLSSSNITGSIRWTHEPRVDLTTAAGYQRCVVQAYRGLSRDRKPRILPGQHATGQVCRAVKALEGEEFGGEVAPGAAPAHQNQVSVGGELGSTLRELGQRDVQGSGDMSFRPLLRFSHVHEHGLA